MRAIWFGSFLHPIRSFQLESPDALVKALAFSGVSWSFGTPPFVSVKPFHGFKGKENKASEAGLRELINKYSIVLDVPKKTLNLICHRKYLFSFQRYGYR